MSATTDALPSLPDDVEGLRALVLALIAKLEATVNERDALAEQNDRIRHLLLKLKRMQFGAKSERLPEEQLQLGLEALEQAIARGEAEAEKHDPDLRKDGVAKRRASRGALPAHLPRIEVTLAPEATACPCCKAAMTVIGEDSSERLDVIPEQFRVIVTRRPKLICRSCAGAVVQMPAPPRLIEGGIPTESMVAHVLVARYADHLPLYRQAQILARQGVILDRSTLSFWMGYAAAELAPVVARLREMMLSSTRLFADETVVPVLDPGRGRTKQGYFWAIARDDRPWGGSQPPAVVYSYAPGREHIHANTLLGGYRGILQCDGYVAYKKLVGPKQHEHAVTLVFCWSHVRRGFYDQAKTGTAPIATEALRRIAALYAIEARVRGKSQAERLAVRQAESRPLVTDLRAWFEVQLGRLPARGPTAEAIRYALNHWDGLEHFLADGRIEIDTNTVERSMRPVALSRKNSLFAGSDSGASYCSSGDVLIKQRNSATDFEISGAVTAWPRRRGTQRPAVGQQA
ncbi:MAG TPA: IS66 family transposase, partial [Pirellulales bacterium]|nr:IS66 family transposase [Pirellulales bacterium]